jgi:hypothetical protein
VENVLAGWNIGDAIARLAVTESKDLAAFVEKREKAILEPSEGGSTGTIGIGWQPQSANDAS